MRTDPAPPVRYLAAEVAVIAVGWVVRAGLAGLVMLGGLVALVVWAW